MHTVCPYIQGALGAQQGCLAWASKPWWRGVGRGRRCGFTKKFLGNGDQPRPVSSESPRQRWHRPGGTQWKTRTSQLSISATESVLHPFETSLRNKDRYCYQLWFLRRKELRFSHSHLHHSSRLESTLPSRFWCNCLEHTVPFTLTATRAHQSRQGPSWSPACPGTCTSNASGS